MWLFLVGCSLSPVPEVVAASLAPSGSSASALRDLDGFTAIRLDSSVDVDVTVGGPQSVRVVAPADQQATVLTRVRDGELVVDSTSGVFVNVTRRVEVTVPRLDMLTLDASGDARVEDLAGKELTVRIDGSGDATLSGSVDALTVVVDGSGDLEAIGLDGTAVVVESDASGDVLLRGRVRALAVASAASGDVQVDGVAGAATVSVRGSGDLALAGEGDALDLAVGGSGDVSARDYRVRAAQVRMNGSGDATIHATEVVAGRVNGSGDLTVVGGGRVMVQGDGDVHQR